MNVLFVVLETYGKLREQMKSKRYYPALKTLEQLEHTYLPRVSKYRFSQVSNRVACAYVECLVRVQEVYPSWGDLLSTVTTCYCPHENTSDHTFADGCFSVESVITVTQKLLIFFYDFFSTVLSDLRLNKFWHKLD